MAKFSSEQTKNIVSCYLAADDKDTMVEDLAHNYSVTKKSIIGKLVSEKVYVRKAPKTQARATNEEYALGIKIMLGMRTEEISSLSNMTIKDLIAFSERLVLISNLQEAK